jgi:hypothetical protein
MASQSASPDEILAKKALGQEAISTINAMNLSDTVVVLIENVTSPTINITGAVLKSKNTVIAITNAYTLQNLSIDIETTENPDNAKLNSSVVVNSTSSSTELDLKKIQTYLSAPNPLDLILINPMKLNDKRVLTTRPGTTIVNASDMSLNTLLTPSGGGFYLIIPKDTPNINVILSRDASHDKLYSEPEHPSCPVCPVVDTDSYPPEIFWGMLIIMFMGFLAMFFLANSDNNKALQTGAKRS